MPRARPSARYRIDELGRLAGVSSRNIRALQARGIIPTPQLVGRTGYYTDGDLEILRATVRLQDRGYSLAAVADLLAAWRAGATLEDVVGLPPQARPADRTSDEDDWASSFDEIAPRGRTRLAVVPGYLLEPLVS